MRIKFIPTLLLLLFIVVTCRTNAATNFEALGRRAVSENSGEAGPAIAELRAMGPAGLNTLFELYASEITGHVVKPMEPTTPEWYRLSAALDAVSQQKDSYLSGLYWYTDLSQAKAAAKSSGKPILSLRLLGKLSEEFSCANSRFFRTVLYSNAEVSKVLGGQFILHWQSVRPAPRVTIDFGDGRRIERTVTGNSIHYVLDSEALPLDALPGLYGPQAFLSRLAQVEKLFAGLKGKDAAAQWEMRDSYHREAIKAITRNWVDESAMVGGKIPRHLLPEGAFKGSPRAVDIAPLAVTKAATEAGILRAMTRDADALGSVTGEDTWKRIAQRHTADAQLDDRSLGLMRRQTQSLLAADGAAGSAGKFDALVRKFQLSVALDTVRNEYELHAKLHAWLIADPRRSDVNALNEKVYAELFLTPKSDPWLGLYGEDIYTALEGGGISH